MLVKVEAQYPTSGGRPILVAGGGSGGDARTRREKAGRFIGGLAGGLGAFAGKHRSLGSLAQAIVSGYAQGKDLGGGAAKNLFWVTPEAQARAAQRHANRQTRAKKVAVERYGGYDKDGNWIEPKSSEEKPYTSPMLDQIEELKRRTNQPSEEVVVTPENRQLTQGTQDAMFEETFDNGDIAVENPKEPFGLLHAPNKEDLREARNQSNEVLVDSTMPRVSEYEDGQKIAITDKHMRGFDDSLDPKLAQSYVDRFSLSPEEKVDYRPAPVVPGKVLVRETDTSIADAMDPTKDWAEDEDDWGPTPLNVLQEGVESLGQDEGLSPEFDRGFEEAKRNEIGRDLVQHVKDRGLDTPRIASEGSSSLIGTGKGGRVLVDNPFGVVEQETVERDAVPIGWEVPVRTVSTEAARAVEEGKFPSGEGTQYWQHPEVGTDIGDKFNLHTLREAVDEIEGRAVAVEHPVYGSKEVTTPMRTGEGYETSDSEKRNALLSNRSPTLPPVDSPMAIMGPTPGLTNQLENQDIQAQNDPSNFDEQDANRDGAPPIPPAGPPVGPPKGPPSGPPSGPPTRPPNPVTAAFEAGKGAVTPTPSVADKIVADDQGNYSVDRLPVVGIRKARRGILVV